MMRAESLGAVRERERERELHFSKNECGFVQQPDTHLIFINNGTCLQNNIIIKEKMKKYMKEYYAKLI